MIAQNGERENDDCPTAQQYRMMLPTQRFRCPDREVVRVVFISLHFMARTGPTSKVQFFLRQGAFNGRMPWTRVKTSGKLLTPCQYIYTARQSEVAFISQHENLRGKKL